MDEADLAALIELGKRLSAIKLFVTGANFLWLYDYFLTLEDEVKYGWQGRKSWVFALFIANRYTPIMFIIWINLFTFGLSVSPCPRCESKWVGYLYSIAITFFAQAAIALRVYAVTQRNTWIASALSVTMAAQVGFGMYLIVEVGRSPLLPSFGINLDAFNTCAVQRGRVGDLIFGYITIFFDTVAFLAILITVKKRGGHRYPGIPSLLDSILRDATINFIIVFVYNLIQQLFLIAAPEAIQRAPGVIQPIFVPMVATHLMLSLKKAAVEPTGPWSVATMTDASTGSPQNGTLRFVSRMFSASRGTSAPPNEDNIELDSLPSLPRNRRSRQQLPSSP